MNDKTSKDIARVTVANASVRAGRRMLGGVCAGALLVALGAVSTTTANAAEDLNGWWRGAGTVVYSNGAKEKVQCRAHYSRRGQNLYQVNATCATPSGKAQQTASLQKVGDNTYRGGFNNAEYNVSGTMYVVVKGSGQNVRLSSSSGTASLRLTR